MSLRRKLLLLAAVSALAPLPICAQPSRKHRVGLLSGGSIQSDQNVFAHLKRGMQELGYVEGTHVEYLQRAADGFMDRVPSLAREFAEAHAEVVVSAATVVARVVQKTIATLPLVLAGGFDPVSAGAASSLARPGGSLTGIVNLSDELARKHLELLRELRPRARRIGVLAWPNVVMDKALAELRAVFKQYDMEMVVADARVPDEIEPALSRLGAASVQALIVMASPLFRSEKAAVVGHAARLRVPAVYPDGEYVEAGGLASYGPNRADIYYRCARYVDKILKGAHPGDLPIEQPTKFELLANMKTAKALGVKIPDVILLRADKVIE